MFLFARGGEARRGERTSCHGSTHEGTEGAEREARCVCTIPGMTLVLFSAEPRHACKQEQYET